MKTVKLGKQEYIVYGRKDKVSWKTTSYQSCIDIKYDLLVSLFGEPTRIDGDKEDAEWILECDKALLTIYNYKTGKNYLGDKGAETKDITRWHIGARQLYKAVELKANLFNEQQNAKKRIR